MNAPMTREEMEKKEPVRVMSVEQIREQYRIDFHESPKGHKYTEYLEGLMRAVLSDDESLRLREEQMKVEMGVMRAQIETAGRLLEQDAIEYMRFRKELNEAGEDREKWMRMAWNASLQTVREPTALWSGSQESFEEWYKKQEDRYFAAFLSSLKERGEK